MLNIEEIEIRLTMMSTIVDFLELKNLTNIKKFMVLTISKNCLQIITVKENFSQIFNCLQT
jgi:hypothetical protein